MADDHVQLTDLEVIQRYSLAVRGASASRSELIAALQADLDWLQGSRRPAAATSAPQKTARKAPAAKKATPAKAPAAKKAAAAKRQA